MTYLRMILILSFLPGLSACSPLNRPTSTPADFPSPAAIAPSATLTVIPTATPLTCLSQPGRVDSGELDSTKPPQLFLIYLPPCYDQNISERYPVVYLLHGQTYDDDEWIRLGAPSAADALIHSGKAPPFIIVFPDDRYWNLPPGPGFGDRLINLIIPYVDQHYRTLADRAHRALGGLSRGGGWTIELGLKHYDMFGALGMHSPAIFVTDAPYLEDWIRMVPSNSWPRIWMDAGDQDKELGTIMQFESLLSDYQIPHEWHLYTGDHSENYWHAHVEEYLQWYAEGWSAESPTPQP
jgi:enterochelin esterase-like enzyme